MFSKIKLLTKELKSKIAILRSKSWNALYDNLNEAYYTNEAKAMWNKLKITTGLNYVFTNPQTVVTETINKDLWRTQ